MSRARRAAGRGQLTAACAVRPGRACAGVRGRAWGAAHPVTARMMMLEETAQMLPVPICFLVSLSEVSSRM